MSAGFILVKSLDSPQAVTDPLNFSNDEDFKADDYRELAASICSHVTWAEEVGQAEISGFPVSLEPTDAGLFVAFQTPDVPSDIVQLLVSGAMNAGAIVMSTESAEIISGDLSG